MLIIPETVGKWHNEALKQLMITSYYEKIDIVCEFLINQKYDTPEVITNCKNEIIGSRLLEWIALNKYFGNAYPDKNQAQFLTNAGEELATVIKPKYSDALMTALQDYINLVPTVSSLDDFLAKAEAIFDKPFTGDDLEVSEIVMAVSKKSKQFWEETGFEPKLQHSTWVIINDGIGAALGSIFGGVGGAIVGAALSACVNEGFH